MRSTQTYFDFPFGIYSGVIMDEHTMKKVAKLLYRQNQELKELLMANVDHLKISNWTLAYPNGKQESIHYVSDKNYQTIEERINILGKTLRVQRVEHLYFGTAEEAQAEHMKLYDEDTEVSA